ncbi:MAG: hypothetical protein GXP48_05370 [Acidobacteria bacterium]|nr:hypothetical protein [Acidobacteriota bacterium]
MRLKRVLHVFRNTPVGRETLLGALHLCSMTGMQLYLYRPEVPRFTLQFEDELIEVPLDASYVQDHRTAKRHAEELCAGKRSTIHWIKTHHQLASTLPVIPDDFDLMTCPHSLAGQGHERGGGIVGSRVRRLIRTAPHPVIILPAPLVEWDQITVFFEGSSHAVCALAWARALAKAAGMTYQVFTQDEGHAVARASQALESNGWLKEVQQRWRILPKGPFENNLWEVPRTSLVVAGAFGSSGVKARLFGSRTEMLLSQLVNPFFLVGPNARKP